MVQTSADRGIISHPLVDGVPSGVIMEANAVEHQPFVDNSVFNVPYF